MSLGGTSVPDAVDGGGGTNDVGHAVGHAVDKRRSARSQDLNETEQMFGFVGILQLGVRVALFGH